MKKTLIILLIWTMALFTFGSIQAKSELEYKIMYDAKNEKTYSLKNKIQEIYSELVSGIHKESYLYMVVHNLDMFEYKSDIKASWVDNALLIQEGDGKGDEIYGTLSANSICVSEVQPRSYFAELFK